MLALVIGRIAPGAPDLGPSQDEQNVFVTPQARAKTYWESEALFHTCLKVCERCVRIWRTSLPRPMPKGTYICGFP